MLQRVATTMGKSKVIIIAPTPFDFDRGKSIRVRQSVKIISGLGYNIDILTYYSGREFDDPSVRIVRAPCIFQRENPGTPGLEKGDLSSDIYLLWKAVQLLRLEEYTAIHAHDVDGAVIGCIAKKILRREIPLVYDMHGTFATLSDNYNLPIPRRIIDFVEQSIYDESSYLVYNWPSVENFIDAQTPSILILDQPEVYVQELLSHTLSSEESLEGKPYILYTGNYAPYQGVNLLLEAYQQLVRTSGKADDTQLVLTGDAPEEYIVDDERIHYVGFVSDEKLASLMQNAAVLVSPRRTEGFPPMKILYYILTDNPIVVTDKSCHTTVLSGVEGVFFAEPTPKKFAVELRRALETEETYHRPELQQNVEEKYATVYKEIDP